MTLSPEDIQDIVRLVDSTAYDEVELATDRFLLRLRRGPGGWTGEHQTAGPPHRLGDDPGSEDAGRAGGAPAATATATATATVAGAGDRPGLVPVRAPLPGVFYRAPKPGAAPFVEVGQHVGPEDVVAILETMKLMNPVRAGAAGTVGEIVVDNSEPAEQGAVLLWLDPDSGGEASGGAGASGGGEASGGGDGAGPGR